MVTETIILPNISFVFYTEDITTGFQYSY